MILFPAVTFGYGDFSYRCDEYTNPRNDEELRKKAECQCAAPTMNYLLDKLKVSFQATDGEQLLKEIVTGPENYASREELKSLYRQLHTSRILLRQSLKDKMAAEFEKIIDGAKLREGIPDFPTKGQKASLLSNENSLVLKINSLDTETISFLPEETISKISPWIMIRYYYPIDKFEYVVTFNNEELPLQKAMTRIQSEFESACYNRFWENVSIRKSNSKERNGRSGSSSTRQ